MVAISNYFVGDTYQVYSDIRKPPLSPPGYLFGIAWFFLYTIMSVAVAIVYNEQCENAECETNKQEAIILYGIQLLFNILWPIFFFGFQWYFFSFAWLVALWVIIVKTIIAFAKVNKVAAILLLPYLVWVTFAGYLNLFIYLMN